MARPISGLTPSEEPVIRARLQRDKATVATLYHDALGRFESIYGEGVGPAKKTPAYLGCKLAFAGVAEQIDATPAPNGDTHLAVLWDQLQRCYSTGQRWTGPAEMATFGSDLRAMAGGATLVLSYAGAASGSPLAPEIYSSLPPSDRSVDGAL